MKLPRLPWKKLKIPRIKIPKIKIFKMKVSNIVKVNHLKIKKGFWRKVFWVAISLFITYLLIGVGFGIAIYKYHSQNETTRLIAKIYPYPAAWVGFSPIWVKNYLKMDSYIKKYYQETEKTLPDEKVLRKMIIDQLIDVKIHSKLAKEHKVSVTSEEIEDAYNKVIEEKNYQPEEVGEILSKMYNMNIGDFKELIGDQLLLEKVKRQLFTSVKISHILIRDESLAKEILEKAKAGEDFSELAKKYSEDIATNEVGGDLGWNGRGDLIPEIENVAFGLGEGEIYGDLVKTEEYGYHIIKVDNKEEGVIEGSYQAWYENILNNTKIRYWLK